MSSVVIIFCVLYNLFFIGCYSQSNDTFQRISVTLDLQPQSPTNDNITSGIIAIVHMELNVTLDTNEYHLEIDKVNSTRFVIQIDIYTPHEITLDEVIINTTSVKNHIEMEYNVTVINLFINQPDDDTDTKTPSYQQTNNTFMLVIISGASIMCCCITILIICICAKRTKDKSQENIEIEYNNKSSVIAHLNTDSTFAESPQSHKSLNSDESTETNDDIDDTMEPLQDLEPGQLQDALPLDLSPIIEEQDEDQQIETMPTQSEAERDVMEAHNDEEIHFGTNGRISIPLVIGELDEQFSAGIEGPRSTRLRSRSLPKGLSIRKQGIGCMSFDSEIAYNV